MLKGACSLCIILIPGNEIANVFPDNRDLNFRGWEAATPQNQRSPPIFQPNLPVCAKSRRFATAAVGSEIAYLFMEVFYPNSQRFAYHKESRSVRGTLCVKISR
jgi:hypothetical protein